MAENENPDPNAQTPESNDESTKSNAGSSSSRSGSSGKGQTTTRAKGRRSGQRDEQQEKDQADENRFTSPDTLTDIKAAQGPLQPTAIDAQGIERIVGPAVDDNWEPAQVDPDPAAIEHHQLVLAAEAERRERRLGATQAKPESTREGTEVTRKALEAERAAQTKGSGKESGGSGKKGSDDPKKES